MLQVLQKYPVSSWSASHTKSRKLLDIASLRRTILPTGLDLGLLQKACNIEIITKWEKQFLQFLRLELINKCKIFNHYLQIYKAIWLIGLRHCHLNREILVMKY